MNQEQQKQPTDLVQDKMTNIDPIHQIQQARQSNPFSEFLIADLSYAANQNLPLSPQVVNKNKKLKIKINQNIKIIKKAPEQVVEPNSQPLDLSQQNLKQNAQFQDDDRKQQAYRYLSQLEDESFAQRVVYGSDAEKYEEEKQDELHGYYSNYNYNYQQRCQRETISNHSISYFLSEPISILDSIRSNYDPNTTANNQKKDDDYCDSCLSQSIEGAQAVVKVAGEKSKINFLDQSQTYKHLWNRYTQMKQNNYTRDDTDFIMLLEQQSKGFDRRNAEVAIHNKSLDFLKRQQLLLQQDQDKRLETLRIRQVQEDQEQKVKDEDLKLVGKKDQELMKEDLKYLKDQIEQKKKQIEFLNQVVAQKEFDLLDKEEYKKLEAPKFQTIEEQEQFCYTEVKSQLQCLQDNNFGPISILELIDNAKQVSEDQDEDLTCQICQNIICDPVMCKNNSCQQFYCRECINEWWQQNKNCPNCRYYNLGFSQIGRRLMNMIDATQVVCGHCQQVVSYKHLVSDHINSCNVATLKCPLGCKVNLGKLNYNIVVDSKDDIEKKAIEHMHRCPEGLITCSKCQLPFKQKYQDKLIKHEQKCNKAMCSKCGIRVMAFMMVSHVCSDDKDKYLIENDASNLAENKKNEEISQVQAQKLPDWPKRIINKFQNLVRDQQKQNQKLLNQPINRFDSDSEICDDESDEYHFDSEEEYQDEQSDEYKEQREQIRQILQQKYQLYQKQQKRLNELEERERQYINQLKVQEKPNYFKSRWTAIKYYASSQTSMIKKMERNVDGQQNCFVNRRQFWNELLKIHNLNFNRRADQANVKNFKIMDNFLDSLKDGILID